MRIKVKNNLNNLLKIITFIIFIYLIFHLFKIFVKNNEVLITYYFMNIIIIYIDTIKNNKIQQIIYNVIYPKDKIKKSPLYSMCKYNEISLNKYNKRIEIDDANDYSILKFNINTNELIENMALNCLQNIINNKTVYLNNIPIKMNDCVIVDVFNTTLTQFNTFHTDIEYLNFNGNAFNVWYLIENNEESGNMFLLESPDYKKEYTPCFLLDDIVNNNFPIMKQSFLGSIINGYDQIGNINKNNVKITYANLKNGECLIMSKHLLHRTDINRNNQFRGFNFRVIIKNEDGSINYVNKYNNKKPYHIYDEEHHKIFGVKILDFI